MEFAELHAWQCDCRGAIELQHALAARVVLQNRLPQSLASVAGVDVSYEKHGRKFFAAVVVLRWPGLERIAESSAIRQVDFPYVPGLLSFRELPVLLEAFRGLALRPDVVLVDGQGIAHPRRFGLASHLGLWLDVPTIGCAKSRLCGEHAPPGPCRGDRVPLMLGDEEIGAVVTTRDRVKPLYVSPGHLVEMASAVELTLACTKGYRLPEPTRLAHHLTNRLRRGGD